MWRWTAASMTALRRDRPYERLNITGIKGLIEAERLTLKEDRARSRAD